MMDLNEKCGFFFFFFFANYDDEVIDFFIIFILDRTFFITKDKF